MTKVRFVSGCLLTLGLATSVQAQVWPQAENAYQTTQQSPQWIENQTQAHAPTYPVYGYQPPVNNAPLGMMPNAGYAPYYGAPQYPQYSYMPNYYGQNNWNSMPMNGPANMPWGNQNPWNSNNGNTPWNAWRNGDFNMGNWSMPNMNMPSMPNMQMPSPTFTIPNMPMPFWN